jgi:predicted RecB family nuclease
VETKLARSTKATALVQLCFYSDFLSRMQGVEPQWMHVVLGGAATPERFQLQRYSAYFRKVISEFAGVEARSGHLPRTHRALRAVFVVPAVRHAP